jgi:hypothetical protein
VSVDVPSLILPNDYEGRLHDVRVFVKFGPDDPVYDNNKEIRERVCKILRNIIKKYILLLLLLLSH